MPTSSPAGNTGSYTGINPNTGQSNSAFNSSQQDSSLSFTTPSGTSVTGTGDVLSTPENPPAISPTMDASSINNNVSGNTTPVTLPNTPNTNPNPNTLTTIPTISSIENAGGEMTPAEQTNKTLSDQLLNEMQQLGGRSAAQTAAEAKLGLPDLNSQLNDLNSQIETLKNNAQAIPIQDQTNATGRGITAAGLAPITAAELRNNTVQALGLSSLASTLRGNIANAQAQADKAVAAQFDPIQAQIDYLTKAIELNKPQMTKEEQIQANTVTAQLADRQRQLDQQKADKSTIIAWANAAVSNNPGNQAAQAAAQKALQTNDLATAFSLVGQYQKDPIATQKALADLQLTRAQINKTQADANATAVQNQADNTDIVSLIQGISNPNATQTSLGGLTLNGLNQKAQAYLTNGGNIQGLGLSGKGNVALQRAMIQNYAGYLADKMGLTVPQITALYKANSKAAGQVISRAAKIETTSATLSAQFPRLQQLAQQVGNLGISEQDVTAGKIATEKKFNSVAAGNYVELLQTIRSDYSAMQASVAGSSGAQYFSEAADKAIPAGASPDVYAGLAQTIQGSAALAQKASGDEVSSLLGTGGTNTNASSTVKLQDPKTGEIRTFNNLSASDLKDALDKGYKQL